MGQERLRAGLVAAAALTLAGLVGLVEPLPSAADFNLMSDAVGALDANRDGTIDRAEWKIAGLRTFGALDGNEDGVIGLEEFVLLRTAMFVAIDRNRDGVVTADEADAYKRLPWTLGLAR